DLLCWGLHDGTMLQLDRTGHEGLITLMFYEVPTVYLQIQRTGNTYTFLHRTDPLERWIVDGSHRAGESVDGVGLSAAIRDAATPLTIVGDNVTLTLGHGAAEVSAARYDGSPASAFVEPAGDAGRWDPFAHQYTFGSIFK